MDCTCTPAVEAPWCNYGGFNVCQLLQQVGVRPIVSTVSPVTQLGQHRITQSMVTFTPKTSMATGMNLLPLFILVCFLHISWVSIPTYRLHFLVNILFFSLLVTQETHDVYISSSFITCSLLPLKAHLFPPLCEDESWVHIYPKVGNGIRSCCILSGTVRLRLQG